MINRKIKINVIVVGLFMSALLVIICLCSCNLNNIKPVTLDDFKDAAAKHGQESNLEPLKSADKKVIGYSIKNNSSTKPSSLIFYDVNSEENVNKLYETCKNKVTKESSMEHVLCTVKEDSKGNYEYIKATDFKVDDKYQIELDLQISYAIRVDNTCLFLVACSNEYNDYVSIVNDIGYMVR